MKIIDKLFNRSYGSRVKVPTILQMEATECGAASLAMILAHYDLWIPLEKLRQECGVNRVYFVRQKTEIVTQTATN